MPDEQRVFISQTVTIASSATTSGSADLQGLGLVGLIMPAAFTGTTMSFQVSIDNSTFYDLYNTNNTLVSMAVTQGRAYSFVPGDLLGYRYIKVKSGSTEGGSRVITLVQRVLQ